MSDHDRRVMAVFEQAVELEGSARVAFLAEACGPDTKLRREVESLLRIDQAPPSRLRTPALGYAAVEALAAMEQPLDPRHLPERIGQYRILSRLGQGGMGTVFRAEQERPRRVVALKLMRGGLGSPSLTRRFEYEAEILGRLQHPGIARIYEAGTFLDSTGYHPYIALELVDGAPIDEHCRTQSSGIRERIELVAKVCDAIQHAHQHGVIHRDLKPANILVDREGEPKLLDFGVARAAGPDLTTAGTMTGQFIGTLPYMSPEQVSGSPDSVDTRSDVYAIGVILFQLLTGRLPYNVLDCSVPEAARVIRDEPPTRLGSTNKTFRGDLETIVNKALEKDKFRRYQSAAELAADLRRFMSGEAIEAKRDSALYVLRKTLRRYRGAVFAAAAVLLTLLIFAIHAVVTADRYYRLAASERRSRTEAEDARDLADAERRRADTAAGQLVRELGVSQIERGRLQGRAGNMRAAEELIWPQLLDSPDSIQAYWALWEFYSLQPCLATWRLHDDTISALAVAPDGESIVTGAFDKTLRAWRLADGQPLGDLTGHHAIVRGLLYLPDGKLVSAAEDGRVIIWDVATQTQLRNWNAESGPLQSLAVSPNGDRLATGGNRGRIRLWDTDGRSVAEMPRVGGVVWSLDFDAAGQNLLAGSDDRLARVFDIAWRTETLRLTGHTLGVGQALFMPDGRRIATGSGDQTLRIWDMGTGEEIEQLTRSNGTIRGLAISPDNNLLAGGGWWRTDLYHARYGESTTAFAGPVIRLAFTPDGARLIIAGGESNRLVRVWEVRPHQERRILRGDIASVFSLEWSPDGRWLAVGGRGGEVELWSLEFGAVAWKVAAHKDTVADVAFSPDSRLLGTCGRDALAHVWSVDGGKLLADLTGHTSWVNAIRFAPDGRAIATVSRDRTIKLWDWPGGAARATLTGPTSEALDVAFSPDSSLLCAVSRIRRVDLWRLPECQPLATYQSNNDLWTVNFSPDSRRLAIGTWRPSVEILDVATGANLVEMRGPTQLVAGAMYFPDGRLIASSSIEGTAMLWDSASGQNLATLSAGEGARLRGLTMSPDGRFLAAGLDDGAVVIWDLHRYDAHIAGNRDYQAAQLAFRRAAATQPVSAPALPPASGPAESAPATSQSTDN